MATYFNNLQKNKQEQTSAIQSFGDRFKPKTQGTTSVIEGNQMSYNKPPTFERPTTSTPVSQPAPQPAPAPKATPAVSSTVGMEGYGKWTETGWEPSASTEPTVGAAYKNYAYETPSSEYDSALSAMIGRARTGATSTIDEDKIRRNMLRMYQAEIDAANEIYAQKYAEAKQSGLGRLGSTRAIQARSGLLGSDFGAAQDAEMTKYNEGILSSINAEKQAAIGAILGTARKEAADEIAAKRAAQTSDAETYLNYLSTQSTRNESRIAALAEDMISNQVELKDLAPDQLKQLASDLGVSVGDIKKGYNDTIARKQKEAQEAAIKGRFTLGEGSAMYDAEGNEIASRAKTYAPSGGGLGSGGLYSMFDSKTANAVISQGDKFANQPIVKTYNNLVSAANFINGIDPNTTNPASHQAIIYNYAKMLDPDSVVREGEYATIKKYSQSLLSKYSGELKQALSGKGFLSPAAIQAIQQESQNRVSAYEPQYMNVKNQTKQKINNIAGADVGDMVLLDYEEGYSGGGSGGSEQMITVISPDGVEGTIPASQAAEAEASGYTIMQ